MAVPSPAPLDLSLVIPVYCSGAWIEHLIDRIVLVLTACGGTFEIILVNDASPDQETRDALDRLDRLETAVRVVHFPSNAGQFRATLHGLALARGALVVTMDDDFQHPPEEIPTLVSAIAGRPEVDCIVGAYRVKQHSWLRNLGSSVNAALMRRLLGGPARLTTTSFRVMRRDLAQALAKADGPHVGPHLRMLARKLESVPVSHHPRAGGRSGYRTVRLVREAIRGVTAYFPRFSQHTAGREKP